MIITPPSLRYVYSAFCNFTKKFFLNWKDKVGFLDKTSYIANPTMIVGCENVYMYEDTVIKDAFIYTPKNKFTMKRHSGAAPGLNVITEIPLRKVGHFCYSSDSQETYGEDITIEEDCWLGANVTLLQGVTVRRGTNVAAGAVVNKSTLPYCVVGGVPAKTIKIYWTIDQIMEHERQLYPEEERYTREQLMEFYKPYITD